MASASPEVITVAVCSCRHQQGGSYPEPGWLEVADSLLSQIIHSTSIGHLHTVRFRNGIWHGNEPQPSLTLDTACLGSGHPSAYRQLS